MKKKISEKRLMSIKRELQARARKMRMGKERSGAYIFGTLRRIQGNPAKCEVITSTDWDDKENTLVFEKNMKPVCMGQKVRSRETYVVTGGQAPHKPSSSGRVYVKQVGEDGWGRQFFPNVFKMIWVPSYNLYPVDKVTQEPRFKLRGNPIQTKIERFRRILSERQSAVIQGTRVDTYAASAVVSVYDKLDSRRRVQFVKMSVPKMVSVAISIIAEQWRSDFDKRQ